MTREKSGMTREKSGMTGKKRYDAKNVAITIKLYTINTMKSGGYVYIMASKRMGTLYIGSTSDLIVRVWEHKNRIYPKSFTAKYNCNKLVYYEYHESLEYMVKRERELKEWNRNWKIRLIIETNPEWNDLYPDFLIANGYSPE